MLKFQQIGECSVWLKLRLFNWVIVLFFFGNVGFSLFGRCIYSNVIGKVNSSGSVVRVKKFVCQLNWVISLVSSGGSSIVISLVL